jgi:hypothetical protein
MMVRVGVLGVLVLVLAGCASGTTPAARHPTDADRRCTARWFLRGYQALYDSPSEYAGPGVIFFATALTEARAEITQPVYYVPGNTAGITMCPGTRGHLLAIEVATDPATGTKLYAVGDASGSP